MVDFFIYFFIAMSSIGGRGWVGVGGTNTYDALPGSKSVRPSHLQFEVKSPTMADVNAYC